MATWVVHMMVVDKLFELGIDLDRKGFSVGNIAPDCNVENEDWTAYTPPREVTHWMNGRSKLTADFEGFYDEYINGKQTHDFEELSFMFGYYAHLIVDVEFQRFVRDVDRVKEIYSRLAHDPDLLREVEGYPHDFDTLKMVFGRRQIFGDISSHEMKYLKDNPKSMYNTILKKIVSYPDYIDYLPEGAIARKLELISNYLEDTRILEDHVFFTQEEVRGFVKKTSSMINDLIKEKLAE